MTLLGYLARNIFLAGGLALALLLSLFSFLGLAEALEDVGKGAFTSYDAFAIVLLTLPARVIDLLPVTTILGSVIGLGIMANSNELTVMRAAGVSVRLLVRGLAAMAAIIIMFMALLQFFVVPMAENRAQSFRSRTFEQTALGPAAFWSRRDSRIIRIGEVEYGRIPKNIEIYELDEQSGITRLLTARRADIMSDDRWILHEVNERVLDESQVLERAIDQTDWNSFLSPDQVATLIAPAHALSPVDLYQFVSRSADSGIDTSAHQARLWRQLSQPFTILGMMLLGLPLVAASVRPRSSGFRVVIGGGIGIAFYLFESISGQLALLFDLNPALTAFAPSLALLAVSALSIRRFL